MLRTPFACRRPLLLLVTGLLLLQPCATLIRAAPAECTDAADPSENCDRSGEPGSGNTDSEQTGLVPPGEDQLPLSPVSASHGATTEQTTPGDSPADLRWELCPEEQTIPVPDIPPVQGGEPTINLFADRATSEDDSIYTLQGNALIIYGRQQLRADSVIYNRSEGMIEALGGMQYQTPGLVITGSRARLFPEDERGVLYDISYLLPDWHGRGSAEVVHIRDRNRQRLDKASYTTCPTGNRDWLLAASRIDLDQQEGMGSARHARLMLKNTPILYTPYISFPIDDRRRSGLLLPKAGSSQETGFDASVPFYWNIAPNYDATLTPRYMSKRGAMLGTLFRYLHRHNSGEIDVNYLPSDREYDNKSRHLATLEHQGNPLPRLETGIDASDVSDKDYFRDLGGNLLNSSTTHLKREADAVYYGDRWKLDTRVLDFQIVDPTIPVDDRPYKELPRIRFGASPATRLLGLHFSLDSEAVEFEKNDTVTGSRLDMQPRLTLPVNRAAYYIKPSASLRYTRYRLDDTAPGDPDDPDRITPVASLDSGLYFDRNLTWRSTDYVQTLEPRLFYLYVPNKNQDDLPVFDTGDYDFNFWQLFLENRFSGPDRMGDANQLALALTTRILDPATGTQRFSASLGNLLYFRDRKVTLPDEPEATDKSSDIIGQMRMALGGGWLARTEVQWNPGETHTNRANALLRYQTGPRQLVNLSYRFRRDTLEQTDVSFLWPVGRNWHLVGRWNYSIDDNQTLETIAGIGYESCCWGINMVARSYVNDENGGRTTGVYFELELKGLTRLGNSIDNILERGILGYESEY